MSAAEQWNCPLCEGVVFGIDSGLLRDNVREHIRMHEFTGFQRAINLIYSGDSGKFNFDEAFLKACKITPAQAVLVGAAK